MKNTFIKISAFVLLSILLTSNILNLHIHIHEDDKSHCINSSEQEHDDDHDEDNNTCELCLLALNLNSLDYYHPTVFSVENISSVDWYNKDTIKNYQQLSYSLLVSDNNRNKAPPHQI